MKNNLVELPIRPVSDNDFLHAACMMDQGGSFADAIGTAYLAADPQNRARLRATFPDLFTQFFGKYQAKMNQDIETKQTPKDILTNEKKRKIVKEMLADGDYCDVATREIARRCGVSPPFVEKIRKQIELERMNQK